ncbi:MAG TPA: glycosyltransferase family 39 protein [Anaerolineae bacterium]|nr:glycosyltransferase family 39 protein [Anaerolineae bacterium]
MRRRLTVALLPAVPLFIFVAHLAAPSLWYDEGYAVYVARLSPAAILAWSSRDVLPPLHSYLLALWLPLAGWSEFSLRFLSVWMGVLMVVGMFRLGCDLLSRRAGLLAASLATLSPFYALYARDGRMYMTLAALGLWSTVFLVRALRSPGRKFLWAGLALGDALTLYTHTTGGFLLLFHGLVILTAGFRRRQALRRGVVALAAAALAWTPWLAYAYPYLGQNAGYWPGRLDWRFVLSETFTGFVVGRETEGGMAAALVLAWALLCLAGLLALLSRSPWKAGFLLAYFAVPVIALAVLFRPVPKFPPRYLILASPPLFLVPAALADGGLFAARTVLARLARGLLLLCAALDFLHGTLPATFLDPARVNPDFRAAARLVQAARSADEIVLIVPGHIFPVWEYYFGPDGWAALPADPILDVRHILHYRETAPRLDALLRGRPGVWLVEWEPWVSDPTDLVPTLLARLGEERPVEEVHGLHLRHYRLRGEHLPPEPEVIPPSSAAFDLPLTLRGCRFPSATPGDAPVEAACYWDSHGTLPLHLELSARLVDDFGTEWARADGPISGPYLVAGRWPQGEPVLGRYAVPPPRGIPPGAFYRLRLLLYEPDGTAHGEAEVAPVVIAPPTRPFTGPVAAAPRRLGGLLLDRVTLAPPTIWPGETVWVTADWRVDGPFAEPRLALADETFPVLPSPGAMGDWRPGDCYHTVTPVTLSPYADGGRLPVRLTSAAGEVVLGRVTVPLTRTFSLPDEARPTDYRLGGAITLAGTRVISDGQTWDVTLYWRAEEYITRSYTVFVHLVGGDGSIVAQADSVPLGGHHPTDHWRPGEVVPDVYRLARPADAPPGPYRLVAGMYEWPSLERLPVCDAAGERVPDDAVPLGW